MISSHLHVTLLFLFGCGILQFTHPSGPNETVLLLYKLLFKVLPVTAFYVRNSVISFYVLCLVHFGAVVLMQLFSLILSNCICACMCISIICSFILYFYGTNLVLWLQDINKLTYLLNG